jgi:DNA-binding MarR family transcriptional regulator
MLFTFNTIKSMKTEAIYEYLERISNLLRTDTRRTGIGLGLQPIQVEALNYLSRCNRYSNSPVAVADFLGLTKGTVSQSLTVLEMAGFIEKRPDANDRRVVHLEVTEPGRRALAQCVPPHNLASALALLDAEQQDFLEESLSGMLRALQSANGLRSFGVCKTCLHHQIRSDDSRHCALTGQDLGREDIEKICREHEAPAVEPTPDSTAS